MKTVRVETNLTPDTEYVLKKYAILKYGGNRGLAVREACEQFAKKARKEMSK